MRLCPGGLAVEVTRRLSENSELCPELRELEVMVTGETRARTIAELMTKVARVRGDGREMITIESLYPVGSQRFTETDYEV